MRASAEAAASRKLGIPIALENDCGRRMMAEHLEAIVQGMCARCYAKRSRSPFLDSFQFADDSGVWHGGPEGEAPRLDLGHDRAEQSNS